MSWTPRFFLAAAAAVSLCAPARAVTYTIQPTVGLATTSQLNLSVTGSAFGGALTVTEQNPAAITRYNGTLNANFTGAPVPGNSISFPGGSAAAAINPLLFPYEPGVGGKGGTAQANYGVKFSIPVGIDLTGVGLGTLQSVDVKMAIRDLVLDVNSGNTLIGAGGAFDANATTLSINSGFSDIAGQLVFKQTGPAGVISAGLLLSTLIAVAPPELGLSVTPNFGNSTVTLGVGTRLDMTDFGVLPLPNTAAADGSVSYTLPSQSSTLILPVKIALPDLEDFGIPPQILALNLSLDGQLRGTATMVPEPSSMVLAGMGLVGLVFFARRRFRKA